MVNIKFKTKVTTYNNEYENEMARIDKKVKQSLQYSWKITHCSNNEQFILKVINHSIYKC